MVLCRVGVWPEWQGEAPWARPPRRQPGLHLPLRCIIHGRTAPVPGLQVQSPGELQVLNLGV